MYFERPVAANSLPGSSEPTVIMGFQCLSAIAKPPDFAAQIENDEFFTLLFSKQSAAMRHLFFSERMAAKVRAECSSKSNVC